MKIERRRSRLDGSQRSYRFGAARVNKVVECRSDGHVAEYPTVTTAAVSKAHFVEGGVGVEPGGECFRLINFVCAGTEVGIQPYRHQIVAASNILDFKDNGSFGPPPRQFIRKGSSRA